MFSIIETTWQKNQRALHQLRTVVFIDEQLVPDDLEWDGLDESAVHLIAWDLGASPIGCARLLPNYTLGRMAVLESHRGQGVGMALLQTCIEYAVEANWPHIKISAQTHAIGFYEKAGFAVTSEVYLDAGIEHRDMVLHLNFFEGTSIN